MLGTGKLPVSAGGGDLQAVGLGDGIRLVKQRAHPAGQVHAVVDGDRLALLVDDNAEDPGGALLDKPHIPQHEAELLRHWAGHAGHDGRRAAGGGAARFGFCCRH